MRQSNRIEGWTLRKHGDTLTAIVYNNGYVYACRFAPDATVTEELIRRSWTTNRRAWRAYDEGTDTFL